MDEAVAAFDVLRNKIGGATLVDMNKTLIYDDVGIALMQYALELYIYIYIYIYIYTCMYTYVYISVYVCTYVYI